MAGKGKDKAMGVNTFDLLLNGVPYLVRAEPYRFNEEPRFRVSYNNGPEYIFVWDQQASRFLAIGDEATALPDDMEEAVGDKLLQLSTNGTG